MRVYAFLLLLSLTGCPANFIEDYEVAEPRLMGVRVEVEGAPERPRPHLTESFALRQYLALPGPLSTPLATRYSIALALCIGFQTTAGTLACIDEQNLTPKLDILSDTEVLLSGIKPDLTSLQLPAGLTDLDVSSLPALANLDRLALFGVFCVDGMAERVPGRSVKSDPPSELFRCTGDASRRFPAPTAFTMSVYLERGLPSDSNKNPLFACDPSTPDSPCNAGVVREGEPLVPGIFVIAHPKNKNQLRVVEPWPEVLDRAALPQQGCAGIPGLLQIEAGGDEYTVRARFDPSDRETYQREIQTNGVEGFREEREPLDLQSALTYRGGDLARFESLLEKTEIDAKGEISVGYTPPDQSDDPTKNVPQNGRLVRFYFTLRDQRGGVDYAMRELCLVPAQSSVP